MTMFKVNNEPVEELEKLNIFHYFPKLAKDQFIRGIVQLNLKEIPNDAFSNNL